MKSLPFRVFPGAFQYAGSQLLYKVSCTIYIGDLTHFLLWNGKRGYKLIRADREGIDDAHLKKMKAYPGETFLHAASCTNTSTTVMSGAARPQRLLGGHVGSRNSDYPFMQTSGVGVSMIGHLYSRQKGVRHFTPRKILLFSTCLTFTASTALTSVDTVIYLLQFWAGDNYLATSNKLQLACEVLFDSLATTRTVFRRLAKSWHAHQEDHAPPYRVKLHLSRTLGAHLDTDVTRDLDILVGRWRRKGGRMWWIGQPPSAQGIARCHSFVSTQMNMWFRKKPSSSFGATGPSPLTCTLPLPNPTFISPPTKQDQKNLRPRALTKQVFFSPSLPASECKLANANPNDTSIDSRIALRVTVQTLPVGVQVSLYRDPTLTRPHHFLGLKSRLEFKDSCFILSFVTSTY
ncbi:hypothetical protein B0H14DRAFT_2619675 [Mycena olivaceomarginata]|nr:hypothetical protein B0H14DRAFT_2619675 [Mycena olivaceomarginata]